MTDKRPLSRKELEAHLNEQLEFLEISALSFDNGIEAEAKRLAVSIRILCHETKNSHSLLGQLGLSSTPYHDSALPLEQASFMTHGGLVWMAMSQNETKFVAMLDDVPITRKIPYAEWWEMPIFRDKAMRSLSRKQIVLTAANQDGGAHVDPSIDQTYSDLARENSLGWIASDGVQELSLPGPEKAAIRQIAHEVLKTFKPGYSKAPSHGADMIVGGSSLVEGNPPLINGFPNPDWEPPGGWGKIGRNDRCPCKSGRKFKRCHGRW